MGRHPQRFTTSPPSFSPNSKTDADAKRRGETDARVGTPATGRKGVVVVAALAAALLVLSVNWASISSRRRAALDAAALEHMRSAASPRVRITYSSTEKGSGGAAAVGLFKTKVAMVTQMGSDGYKEIAVLPEAQSTESAKGRTAEEAEESHGGSGHDITAAVARGAAQVFAILDTLADDLAVSTAASTTTSGVAVTTDLPRIVAASVEWKMAEQRADNAADDAQHVALRPYSLLALRAATVALRRAATAIEAAIDDAGAEATVAFYYAAPVSIQGPGALAASAHAMGALTVGLAVEWRLQSLIAAHLVAPNFPVLQPPSALLRQLLQQKTMKFSKDDVVEFVAWRDAVLAFGSAFADVALALDGERTHLGLVLQSAAATHLSASEVEKDASSDDSLHSFVTAVRSGSFLGTRLHSGLLAAAVSAPSSSSLEPPVEAAAGRGAFATSAAEVQSSELQQLLRQAREALALDEPPVVPVGATASGGHEDDASPPLPRCHRRLHLMRASLLEEAVALAPSAPAPRVAYTAALVDADRVVGAIPTEESVESAGAAAATALRVWQKYTTTYEAAPSQWCGAVSVTWTPGWVVLPRGESELEVALRWFRDRTSTPLSPPADTEADARRDVQEQHRVALRDGCRVPCSDECITPAPFGERWCGPQASSMFLC
jgi:hypothetical protein